MWIWLALCSMLLLGTYDVLRKYALKENAVIPVLFFSTLSSATIFLPLIINPVESSPLLFVEKSSFQTHALIFLKAIIVTSSWIFAFFSFKHLPITIVSPIRSTAPLWTLTGALIIFSERLTPLQLSGILTTIICLVLFSSLGRKEGIFFRTNKWVFFIFLATILGAVSSLFDKYLLTHYPRLTVQAWFHIYNVVLLLPVMFLLWYPRRKKHTPFRWRWSILLVGLFLTLSDYLYFWALSHQDSLISVVSVIRRSNVLISFTWGALIFKDINIRNKLFALLGILVGILLIVLGSG